IRGNLTTPLLGGSVDLTARYGVNDWHAIDRLSAPDSLRLSRYDDDGASGEVGIVYTRPLSERLSLEARLIHEFSDFDSVSTYKAETGGVAAPEQRFASVGDASETIVRGLLRWQRSEALTFEGGAEAAYNR